MPDLSRQAGVTSWVKVKHNLLVHFFPAGNLTSFGNYRLLEPLGTTLNLKHSLRAKRRFLFPIFSERVTLN